MYVDGGTAITPSTTYIFSTTGVHTVVWDLVEPVVPNAAFMHINNTPLPILSVQIGDGVTEIDDYAFFFSNMTAVTIPNSVTKIDYWAFASNPYNKSVVLPTGLTYIGTNAFSRIGNTAITIPESVEEINGTAFASSSLRTINIPGKVMNLNATFQWSTSLHTVTFSPSNRYFLDLNNTFNHCHSLTSITTPNDCSVYLDGAFTNCYSLRSVNIPNADAIGYYNFTGSTALTSVSFPEKVDFVNGYNFNECTSLTSLTLPNAVYYSQAVIDGAGSLQRVQFGNTLSINYNLDLTEDYDKFGNGCSSLNRIDVVCNGVFMFNHDTNIPSGVFVSNLPPNGHVYYYYKSASETDINSQRIAEALVAGIGNGWTAVSGGVWTGTPAE